MSIGIKLNKKDIESLEELSGDKGLLTFFDTESDASSYVRQLYFLDIKSRVAAYYYSLSKRNQQLIGKLVKKLAGGREHHGFNFTLYFRWITKSDDENTRLSQSLVAKYLAKIERTIHTDGEIASGIAKLKKKKKIKEDQVQFQDLRDNLLFSTELIHTGIGYIDIIKPSILEEYFENPKIYMAHRKEEVERKVEIVNQLKNFTVREELEEFAAHTGRGWEELVDRKYCAINYTYSYAYKERNKPIWYKIINYVRLNIIRHLY